MEILFRNHLDVLSGLDSPVFIQLIKTNQEGLQSSGELVVCVFIADLMCLWNCNSMCSASHL